VNVVPATVSVAVRAAPVLAATVKLTVPLPLPDEPAEKVTNVALLVAVQVQPLPAVIGIDPVPPAAPNVELVIAPAVTVQVGVVGGVVESLLEHPYAARNITAVSRRREVIMRAAYTEPRAVGDTYKKFTCSARDQLGRPRAHRRPDQNREKRRIGRFWNRGEPAQ